MAIQDTDLFLIDDAGVSKKIRADKLKGGLDSTYANMKLLVNKPDYSSRFIYCKDLQSNLPDDHWLMVERSDVSYKVNGTDVHDYFPSSPAGATGVITDSHTTPITQGETGTHDLTVASLATPNFVDNEAIRMVSAAGETSSYVPVTNTITNVEQDPNGELTVTTFAASSNQSVLATLPTPFGADGNFLPTSAIDKNLYFNNNSETEGGGPNIWAWSGAPIGTELHMHFTQQKDGFRIEDVIGSITEIKYFDQSGNEITSGNPEVDGTTNGHDKAPKIIQFTLGSADGSFKFRAGSYTRIYTQDWYVPNDIRLTFADPSPDVKFFQPGDVVQSSSSIGANKTPFRYWKYSLESATQDHDPNSSSRFLVLSDGTEFELERLTADNCADQGTFFKGNTPPDLNQTVAGNPTGTPSTLADGVTYETIDGKNSLVKDFGQPTVVINAGGYNVYTGGSRAGIMSISGSNDRVTWTEIARAEAKSDGICGRYYLGDHDGPTFVKVISRDPVARTMVVDGGNWLGSDGTSSGQPAWNQDQVWSDLTSRTGGGLNPDGIKKLFNGEVVGSTYSGAENYGDANLELTTNLPVTAGKSTTIFAYSGKPESTSDSYYIRFTFDNNTTVQWTAGAWTGDAVRQTPQTVPAGATAITKITFFGTSGTSVGTSGIEFDGKLFIDNGLADAPLPQDTIVTGPSKSGTAKTDGVPASTTFRIKNSNGQWVDNTNSNSGADHSGSSAQEFYVKNASGRVSLPRFRDAAISVASDWVFSTNYNEGDYVIHDGKYWYAVSSSFNNEPEPGDTLDWLELGDV